MVLTQKKPVQNSPHVQYNGILRASVSDGDSGIFSAFLQFGIHHSHNDCEVYENAARHAVDKDQKTLFVQLASRKREVINKLKSQQSDSSVLHYSERSQSGIFLSRFLKDIEPGPLTEMEDALNFVTQRERATLALYEKLEKTMRHSSTKALFDYLIRTQNECLEFLRLQWEVLSRNLVTDSVF